MRRTSPDDPVLLHNPRARTGTRAFRRVLRLIEARREDLPGGVRTLALDELGSLERIPSRIVALGGDGTVSAAAQWLFDREASCPLGIIPAGTGNNLAKGLGIPLDLDDAARLAFAGTRTWALDGITYAGAGKEGRMVMIQTSALGFPAEIAARYDALRRRRLLRSLFAPAGPHVYRVLALLGLRAQKRRERSGEKLVRVRVSLPEEEIREELFAIFLGNERSLGGNFLPCPAASVDDGALDLCLIRAGTGESYLKLFRAIAGGEHLALTRTVIYRQTPGPLEIDLSEASPLLIDGDIRDASASYRVEVLPRRFEVVIG